MVAVPNPGVQRMEKAGNQAVEQRAEGNKSGVVQDDPSPWRDAKNSDPS